MWTSAMFLRVAIFSIAPPPDNADYQEAVGELATTVENFAAEDRRAVIRTLQRLLDLVDRYPDEALDDHTIPETVLQSWVILAGLHLAEADDIAASEVMDEAIRTARGQTLPVREYGPKVNQLYKDRRTALETAGTATIEVACEVDCTVVINGRLLPERSETLFLGTYRVWVKAVEGDASWEFHEVVLSTADATATVLYEDPTPPPLEVPPAPMTDSPRTPKRLLPRAAELAGVAAGVGLVIAGAVLLSFDHKCEISKQRLTEDTTPEECGRVYETSPAGLSLLGVGGGLLVVSGVLLSIDEVRVGRERGRQVMVGMSLKF